MTNSIEFPNSIYEFLLENSFKDTDEVYTNGSLLIPTFRVKQAIEHYYKPCEDAINREDAINVAIDAVDEWDGGCNTNRATMISNAITELPSVTPSHEDLKEAYIKGYDYGVKDWFKAKTDKPDIKAEIIKRIEQVRDIDKNVGEYPYNRCIKIIKEVMG